MSLSQTDQCVRTKLHHDVEVLCEIAPPRISITNDEDDEIRVLLEIPPRRFSFSEKKKGRKKDQLGWRVELLRILKQLDNLPDDQLNAELEKVRAEMERMKDEEKKRKMLCPTIHSSRRDCRSKVGSRSQGRVNLRSKSRSASLECRGSLQRLKRSRSRSSPKSQRQRARGDKIE